MRGFLNELRWSTRPTQPRFDLIVQLIQRPARIVPNRLDPRTQRTPHGLVRRYENGQCRQSQPCRQMGDPRVVPHERGRRRRQPIRGFANVLQFDHRRYRRQAIDVVLPEPIPLRRSDHPSDACVRVESVAV